MCMILIEVIHKINQKKVFYQILSPNLRGGGVSKTKIYMKF